MSYEQQGNLKIMTLLSTSNFAAMRKQNIFRQFGDDISCYHPS